MKTIILAGGRGSRISEETDDKPKPMVMLNGRPIIWHLMKIYASQGFDDFLIATGYKGDVIHDWVSNDLKENWSVTAIDTGLDTMTAGRIAKCMDLIPGERVMVSYGDGLGNINIPNLVKFHDSHSMLATVTAVRPPARFGVLESENGVVTHFGEKVQADAGWINGGFFVIESDVRKYLLDELDPFESTALPDLVKEKQLGVYHHHGFWKPMDTLREKLELDEMSRKATPPWFHIV